MENKLGWDASCIQCNYNWTSRKESPSCCPRCKRYDWKKQSNEDEKIINYEDQKV